LPERLDKRSETTVISVKLPMSLLKRFRASCAKSGVNVSETIRDMMEKRIIGK